jgi:bifunctional NMN adenylyltransferase/nudix hydrolase
MNEPTGTGIIVGRFQVFELNDLHRALIREVVERHRKVAIFLGSNPAPSDLNPLEWHFRWEMFHNAFGDTMDILEMPDLPDDRIWSQELDRRILELRPEGEVTVYGTQTGFVERYSGRYAVTGLEAQDEELPDVIDVTQIQSMRSFRAGVIYAMLRRYPTVYPTVDVAVFRNDYREVLLARKENETKFRFPGGFSDPSDESFENAAIRELFEECGELDIAELTYLGSVSVDDWRYRGSADGIITHLYACVLMEGEPVAGDDISEVRWFEAERLRADNFVPEHRPLFDLMKEYLEEVE